MRPRLLLVVPILCAVLCAPGCGSKTPLEPINRSPVVQSLLVFPTTIGPGDSAIIVCTATDPDGDTVVYDWYSGGGLRTSYGFPAFNRYDNTLVVRPGSNITAPLDTAWVYCEVRDGKGGGASAGTVSIIIQQ